VHIKLLYLWKNSPLVNKSPQSLFPSLSCLYLIVIYWIDTSLINEDHRGHVVSHIIGKLGVACWVKMMEVVWAEWFRICEWIRWSGDSFCQISAWFDNVDYQSLLLILCSGRCPWPICPFYAWASFTVNFHLLAKKVKKREEKKNKKWPTSMSFFLIFKFAVWICNLGFKGFDL
jgi:hypothetical protein